MPRSHGRTGRPWRRLVAWVKATMPKVCVLCGQRIDMRLRWPDPMSFSVHHLVSLSRGGRPLDRRNVGPAHLTCNTSAGAGEVEPIRSRDW